MSTDENKLLGRPLFEEGFKNGNLAGGSERCAAGEEALSRKVFGLALALATEPSKLGHLRQMLVQSKEQQAISEGLSSWALGQLDERVMEMALEYAHDAEVLLQILSLVLSTY